MHTAISIPLEDHPMHDVEPAAAPPARHLSLVPPPLSEGEIRAALPPGWTYLGCRDTAQGLRWEASHLSGTVSAPTAQALLGMAKTVTDYHASQGVVAPRTPRRAEEAPAELAGVEFNRRRKRRRRKEKELVRCNLCAGLVFGGEELDHLQVVHLLTPAGAELILSRCFAQPADVPDDDTGEDLTLDDPATALAVPSEEV